MTNALVEYRTIPGVPGKYFDCHPLKISLSTDSCAASWRASNGAKFPQRINCMWCQTGRDHAGSPRQPGDARVCVRCGSGASRLIRHALCISCYNRERECVVGENARGGDPRGLSEKLRPAWFIIRRPEKDPLAARRQTGGPFCLETAAASHGPTAFGIGEKNLVAIMNLIALDEIAKVAERINRDAPVLTSDVGPTYSELRRAGISADQWLRESMGRDAKIQASTRQQQELAA